MIVSAALANNTARIATASLSKCVCVAGPLAARVPISRSRGEEFASRELKGDDELVVSWEWEHPWGKALSSASLGADPQVSSWPAEKPALTGRRHDC